MLQGNERLSRLSRLSQGYYCFGLFVSQVDGSKSAVPYSLFIYTGFIPDTCRLVVSPTREVVRLPSPQVAAQRPSQRPADR